MRLLAVVASLACTLLAAGCNTHDLTCKPGPWRTELWSITPRVEAELRDGCGFPDSEIDYRIRAHGQVLMEGSLEDFERRRAVSRLDPGGVEIAVWDRACIVTTSSVVCREVDYHRW